MRLLKQRLAAATTAATKGAAASNAAAGTAASDSSAGSGDAAAVAAAKAAVEEVDHVLCQLTVAAEPPTPTFSQGMNTELPEGRTFSAKGKKGGRDEEAASYRALAKSLSKAKRCVADASKRMAVPTPRGKRVEASKLAAASLVDQVKQSLRDMHSAKGMLADLRAAAASHRKGTSDKVSDKNESERGKKESLLEKAGTAYTQAKVADRRLCCVRARAHGCVWGFTGHSNPA